jgi:hypothetical protein
MKNCFIDSFPIIFLFQQMQKNHLSAHKKTVLVCLKTMGLFQQQAGFVAERKSACQVA